MKRTIIILITVLALSVAGVLYASHNLFDAMQTLSLVESYTTQFPETMPDFILDPMVGFLCIRPCIER